jgi:hypothetical protein
MQKTHSSDSLAVRCDIIVGTRPEAIKLAPVVKALTKSRDDFLVRVVTSGQHGEICRSALAAFGLAADSELSRIGEADGLCSRWNVRSLVDRAGQQIPTNRTKVCQPPVRILRSGRTQCTERRTTQPHPRLGNHEADSSIRR